MTMHTHSTLRSANRARQQEWDVGNKITLAYRGNELAGEMGEACNVIKKLERERLGIRGSRASASDLADELADVVICADLVAMATGHEMPLNTGYPVAHLSSAPCLGADLSRSVGSLCDDILCGFVRESACINVVRSAQAVAKYYGIDLIAAVTSKFNTTSEKVGLKTRLAVSAKP